MTVSNVQFAARVIRPDKKQAVKLMVRKAFGDEVASNAALYQVNSMADVVSDSSDFVTRVLADAEAPLLSKAFIVVPKDFAVTVSPWTTEKDGATVTTRVKKLSSGTQVVSLSVNSLRRVLVRDAFGADPSRADVFVYAVDSQSGLRDSFWRHRAVLKGEKPGVYQSYYVAKNALEQNVSHSMLDVFRAVVRISSAFSVLDFELRARGQDLVLGMVQDTVKSSDLGWTAVRGRGSRWNSFLNSVPLRNPKNKGAEDI